MPIKKYLLILAAFLAAPAATAAATNRHDALMKAQQFLPGRQFVQSSANITANVKASARHGGAADPDAFFVFNDLQGRGFVIVSADDRTPAILAYAEQGNLDQERIPDNLRYWLHNYATQIAALQGATQALPAQEAPEARSIGPVIEPLLQTKWDQDWPYNKMCPDANYLEYTESGFDTYNRCPTGCVATAVAQVMYYWRWPETCHELPGYETADGKWLKALPHTTFKWDDMAATYCYASPDEAQDAMSQLMRYCGQAFKLSYAPGATNGYADLAVMLKTFGYSKNARALKRDDYTTSQWEAMVYAELAARRPVLYSGASMLGAHQFVVDGYDGRGLFHINWGWSGLPDAYFVLALADPGMEQGTGGSFGAYHSDQRALFNVQPALADEVMRPVMRMLGSHLYPSQMNNTYQREDAMTNFADVFLSSSIITAYPMEPEAEMDVEVGWALYQADECRLLVSQAAATIPAVAEDMLTNETTVSFGAGLPEGSYVLTQVFRFPGDTDWQRCEGYGINSVTVEVTPTTLTMRVPDKYHSSFAVNSMRVSDYPEAGGLVSVMANITNNGQTQRLSPTLWMRRQGEDAWTKCGQTACYIDLGTSADISLNFIQEESGVYDLKLTEGDTEEALQTMTVTIAASEEVDCDGLRYRCTPAYGRATVIQDFEADTSVECPVIRQTVTAGGTDCKVVAIANNAFYGWGMKSITIPEGIVSIGAEAFRHCSRLTKVELPSTLTSIGAYAFYGTMSLTAVVAHIQAPPEIGTEMFMYQYLDYVNNSLSKIPTSAALYVPVGARAAYEASPGWAVFGVIEEGELLEALVDGIRYAYAAGGNTATVVREASYRELTQVTIPPAVVADGKTLRVTAIGHLAFEGCGELTEITLPEGLEVIAERAFAGTGLTDIVLPASLTSIGKEAFASSQINALTLPEGITSVGEKAFANMYQLVRLELPESLTTIGLKLIMGSSSLASVVSHITNPFAISSQTFINEEKYESDAWVSTPSAATLYVPQGELTAYERLAGWNCFAEMKELDLSTRIARVTDVDAQRAVHYDLSGRMISPKARGLHIVRNGSGMSLTF